ncbi:MAG: hypothetical protein H7333_06115 [Bdellovibrionales bacterium]|nr:hypothetical protein [Oligoflexia bacterium]
MKTQFSQLPYAALVLLALTACSHAPLAVTPDANQLSANPYTNEEEMSFVDRVIAQAPARLGAEMVMDIYRGLSNEGKEMMLTQGKSLLGSKKSVTVEMLSERLASESEATGFLKSFRTAHPSYFDMASNATIDSAIAKEAAGRRSMHTAGTSSSGVGMSTSNQELKETVLNLKTISPSVAADYVHVHNVSGVNIADQGTCVTGTKLSAVALKNEAELFRKIRTAVDNMEIRTAECARKTIAAATVLFTATTLKSATPYETVKILSGKCHIPSPGAVSATELDALQKRYPDAKEIPENGAGVCRI